MRKVLLVVDRPNWAFDTIAKQLIITNDRQLHLSIFYLKGHEGEFENACENSELIFFSHWSLSAKRVKPWWCRFHEPVFSKYRLVPRFPFVDIARALTGIHGHHDHDDRKSLPDNKILPASNLIDYLSRFKATNTVSKRLVRFFTEAGLEHVHYTPNGVDVDLFRPTKELGGSSKLRVGCSGTKKRDWKEGITEFIEPLADLPFVEMHIATPEDGRYVPHKEMPEFLNNIDAYICASASEGFPLKVLEASACGRPVITTRVGGCEDLIVDGENGFFVDRNVDSIAEKLRVLNEDRGLLIRMGQRNREIIENNWSWKIRSKQWLDFITANV